MAKPERQREKGRKGDGGQRPGNGRSIIINKIQKETDDWSDKKGGYRYKETLRQRMLEKIPVHSRRK